ncbi:hypothetical protein [Nocardia terpenica]|uniref:Uncharacterized protein n=1 Tax=Nocardia terpenica TaxID=455432 RepID=A0A164K664_9NOCA|nr:hypothetical protein [Nocardia terpenica]KZM71076.1 hypothetical protein AWN90_41940 [Nocardia terpenica]NQE89598.1 hypothetical protein [Nocardia terpenica]
MFGYQFIGRLGDESAEMRFTVSSATGDYRHEDAFGLDWRRNRKVTGGDSFLKAIAGLGGDAKQVAVYLEVPNTCHETSMPGGASVESEVNARYLRETYAVSMFSDSVYVLVFDGPGAGLGVEVDDGLADMVAGLYAGHDIDDGETRQVIERELIDKSWDSWVRGQVAQRLSDAAESLWWDSTPAQQDTLLGEALDRFYRVDGHRLEFEDDSWSVDHEEFAKVFQAVVLASAWSGVSV